MAAASVPAAAVTTSAVVVPDVDARVTRLPIAKLLHASPYALVDERKQRIAERRRSYAQVLFVAWVLSQALGFVYLFASGSAARLRDALRRNIRSPALVRFTFGGLMAYLAALSSLPASVALFRVDDAFGTATESTIAWVRDGFINATIDAVLVGAIVASVLWLVDRTRLWYLYASVGLFAATLLMAFVEPVVVAPLFNRIEPLPARAPIRASLDALAARAGVRGAPIYVADLSRRSRSVVADVAGFGPTKRIVLGDRLLTEATHGEALFLTARELGHYAHGDGFRLSLFWTGLFIFAIAVAVLCADRLPFRRDDDPLSRLTLVFAFMAIAGLLLVPVYNGYSRNIESRADAYALALTHDRASAIRAYVRIADETLAPLCPSRPVRLFFLNSPPIGTRIARAAGRHNPCP